MAFRNKRSLKPESLESRRLLAGDVAVIDNSYGGTLEIIGDGASNGLLIQQTDSSFISGTALLISGMATSDGLTTINGSTSPVKIELYNYDGVIYLINTSLGAGDDLMFVQEAAIPADSHINTGPGNDDVEFTAVQSGLVNITGDGIDDLTIDYFYSYSDIAMNVEQLGDVDIIDARIDGGVALGSVTGNNSVSDNISIVDAYVDDDVAITMNQAGSAAITDSSVGGNVNINTLRGGGHTINIERNSIGRSVSIITRSGDDQIHMGSQSVYDSVSITTAGGADNITFDTLNIDGGDLFLNSGGGNDTLYVENGTWQNANVRTGGGSDNVTIFDLLVEGDAEIRTGSGDDTLQLNGIETAGSFHLRTNKGNDFVQAFNGDFGALDIRLGADDDTLEAAQVIVTNPSIWHGNGGTDTYIEVAASQGPITTISFESNALRDSTSGKSKDDLFADDDWINSVFG